MNTQKSCVTSKLLILLKDCRGKKTVNYWLKTGTIPALNVVAKNIFSFSLVTISVSEKLTKHTLTEIGVSRRL